jgi:hypothetical protein
MKNTIPSFEYALEDRTDYADSAFLVTALHRANQNAVWSAFKRLLDIEVKSVIYSPLHKAQTLLASILVGCQFNKDINARLVPDKVAAACLELERFPDQSQCNILLRRLDNTNLSQLDAIHAERVWRYEPLPGAQWHGYLLIDIDQCGIDADGKHYELACKGYVVRRRGARGYQLSAAWLGKSQLTMGLRLDAGNVHSSTRSRELVELSAARVGEAHRQAVLRIDAGYGIQPEIKWLLATDRSLIAKAAVRKRASGTSAYSVLLTPLVAEFDVVQVWRLCSERQTIEAFFKVAQCFRAQRLWNGQSASPGIQGDLRVPVVHIHRAQPVPVGQARSFRRERLG